LLSREEVERKVIFSVEKSDFLGDEPAAFLGWLHGIIGSSKEGTSLNIKKLLAKAPKDFSGFLDNLFLINISPAFDETELWFAEIIKISRRIKEASFRRQLKEISQKLKLAQQEGKSAQITSLARKFSEISGKLKEAI
jgi:hypothetical protein